MSAEMNGLDCRGPRRYEEYLAHQLSRPQEPQFVLDHYEAHYAVELARRLRQSGVLRPGMGVLCLAARLGAEVRAFINCGCFAIGIDLNPGMGNKWVLPGDFHNLQFASESVDVVFTNSLDHVFDLDRLIDEICRVLTRGGLVIVEVVKGYADGITPDNYASLWWQTIDDVLLPLLSRFELVSRSDFVWPWLGQHIVLRRRDEQPLG